MLRIDYPKALDEQQKEDENAKLEYERKQVMEKRREKIDEEVCVFKHIRKHLFIPFPKINFEKIIIF